MSTYVAEFIEFLYSVGCTPANILDIVADGEKVHRFTVSGDKPRSRNARYCLWVEQDFASGWVINSKEGVTHNWHSKVARKFTDDERREYARNREVQTRERGEKQAVGYARAAAKAERIWKASTAGAHGYLNRKGVVGTGSRVYNGALVVPAYKDRKLVSLQFIREDGEKRFLTGGEIAGAYGSLGRDTSVIYICEGYATAHSVYTATETAAVWAFTAGNLKAVARVIRGKYPDGKIVIVADNDAFTTKPDGAAWNPGIEKGTEAALEIDAYIVWPEFEGEGKHTDANDYGCLYGKDKLKFLLQSARKPQPQPLLSAVDSLIEGGVDGPSVVTEAAAPRPLAVTEADWRSSLICDGKGVVAKSSLKNTMLFLTHLDRYKGIFRYNEFSRQTVVARQPEWCVGEFRVRTVDDNDITNATAALEDIGMTPDRLRVHNAINTAAQQDRFNPAQDYFKTLEWDGKHRLESWLQFYLGAHDDEPEYLAFIGKKWLTAAVKRVFEPGCKFDHVLVIEGEQGRGKSEAMKILSTFGDDMEECYFTDGVTIADLSKDNTVQKMQGSVIVELAELAGFGKKDDQEIKRWLTLQYDDVRLPYARTVTRFLRQFVLAASTNEYEYLKDSSGNRRYWPTKSGKIDLRGLKRDRKQLWAEAYWNYTDGLYIGPTETEMLLAKAAQEKRLAVDAWDDSVMQAIEKLKSVYHTAIKTEMVMQEMGLSLRDRDSRALGRVVNILKANGYESKVIWANGKSVRGWVRGATE